MRGGGINDSYQNNRWRIPPRIMRDSFCLLRYQLDDADMMTHKEIVEDCIRRSPTPISRADIARKTGLTANSVRTILYSHQIDGLIKIHADPGNPNAGVLWFFVHQIDSANLWPHIKQQPRGHCKNEHENVHTMQQSIS